MNAKVICLSNKQYDDEYVSALARKFSLHKKVVELLCSRGFDTEEKIKNFHTPDSSLFHDPFSLSGMEKTVERIKLAGSEGQRIVVFGDYDCDGICSTAILTEYFLSIGIDAVPFVPNRVEGYGLSIEAVEKIAEEYAPDLIITCDCGIGCHKEVEYILDLGMDVIVTDHHEIPLVTPDCLTINPKLAGQDYPFSQLCGAGVAFKLVQAMAGLPEAEKYIDLAAIATIADLVPLVDENRLIVKRGISEIEKRRRPGLKALLASVSIGNEVMSGDIAYKIAPRINAAGRMGDAFRAYQLLISKDPDEISELINKIEKDNTKRKESCDIMYKEAEEDLRFEDLAVSKAVVLSHPSWEKGITGITAARIAGDFKRPTFLITNGQDAYKGTARGIDGLSIYDALSANSDVLLEFGGHSQAAGFSISKENLGDFKRRIVDYYNKIGDEFFEPCIKYDCDIEESDISFDLVRSINSLEPFGNSNLRPVFCLKQGAMTGAQIKEGAHLQLTTARGNTILAFNQLKFADCLTSPLDKKLFVDIDSGTFAGKESIKLILKNFAAELNRKTDNGKLLYNYLMEMDGGTEKTEFFASEEEISGVINSSGLYGTLIIASDFDTYEMLLDKHERLRDFCSDYLIASNKNNYSRILVGSGINFDLAFYDNIIIADRQLSGNLIDKIKRMTKARILCSEKYAYQDILRGIDTDRECFGSYYKTLLKYQSLKADGFFDFCCKVKEAVSDLSIAQLIVCALVFNELGIIGFTDGANQYTINNEKRALSESKIYQFFCGQKI